MNHLRQLMLEELERRNYADGTIRTSFTCGTLQPALPLPPDQLDPEHIRTYQAPCLPRFSSPEHRDPAAGRAALLLRSRIEAFWSTAETPYPKKVRTFRRCSARRR